jgi:hypothetical protein
MPFDSVDDIRRLCRDHRALLAELGLDPRLDLDMRLRTTDKTLPGDLPFPISTAPRGN